MDLKSITNKNGDQKWKRLDKVVGHDGTVIYIRHGRFFIKSHCSCIQFTHDLENSNLNHQIKNIDSSQDEENQENILHRKYQVKPYSSPWSSASCAAAIVYRNHFFCLYQKDKSSDSKVKFRQASNHCKRVLEPAKLAYANKTKESITSQRLGSHDFSRIANSVLNKGKSAIPPLFNGPEVVSSASDKSKLFSENFSKNSNLDDSGISLPVFPSRTNLKLHIIPVTCKMVKKVIMNLYLSQASGPDCIPVVVLKNCA